MAYSAAWSDLQLFPAHAGVIPSTMGAYSVPASFPAHAGVILGTQPPYCLTSAFPRLRGGDPYEQLNEWGKTGFSPPTRG